MAYKEDEREELRKLHTMANEDEETWKTSEFRLEMVKKIYEAIMAARMPTARCSGYIETRFFETAKNKEQYLAFVARLGVHVKEWRVKKDAEEAEEARNGGCGGGNEVAGEGTVHQTLPNPIIAQQNLVKQETGTDSAQQINSANRNKEALAIIPNRTHGTTAVIVEAPLNVSEDNCCAAIANKIGGKQVVGSSRLNGGQICVYLADEQAVESIIRQVGLIVGSNYLNVRRVFTATKLLIDCHNSIPDHKILDELSKFGEVVSSITRIPKSFARSVYVLFNNPETDIPPVLEVTQLACIHCICVIRDDFPFCAICGQNHHYASTCKQQVDTATKKVTKPTNSTLNDFANFVQTGTVKLETEQPKGNINKPPVPSLMDKKNGELVKSVSDGKENGFQKPTQEMIINKKPIVHINITPALDASTLGIRLTAAKSVLPVDGPSISTASDPTMLVSSTSGDSGDTAAPEPSTSGLPTSNVMSLKRSAPQSSDEDDHRKQPNKSNEEIVVSDTDSVSSSMSHSSTSKHKRQSLEKCERDVDELLSAYVHNSKHPISCDQFRKFLISSRGIQNPIPLAKKTTGNILGLIKMLEECHEHAPTDLKQRVERIMKKLRKHI